jgi:hypothetical protein
MALPQDFQFSQSSLQDYMDCARRFELRYIKQLRWPAAEAEPIAERERQMRLGQEFHHMVHQHLIGISADAISRTAADETLLAWWQSYLRSPYNPDQPETPLPPHRYPEVTLAATVAGHRLVAKYDLLAIQPGARALIVDWKTAQRRPQHSTLERRLQTLVYPYLLVEAGTDLNDGQPIEPEQVEMVYWFTNAPEDPAHLRYDSAQHTSARERLETTISQIVRQQTFELTTDVRQCQFCVYRSLCERGVRAGNVSEMEADSENFAALELEFDFDQVAEIEF